MPHSTITGIGHYVPKNVVTNQDLTAVMETSDEWIRERTGIEERRYIDRTKETTTTLAVEASLRAIEDAGIEKEDIDFIIFATLSPDYYFPGAGVLLQRELGIAKTEIAALDIRAQCSGFLYGLTTADQFIRAGTYKKILLVGAEVHSVGLDFSTRGRNVSVIFGDGAGAVIVEATDEPENSVLATRMHSDGTYAEKLSYMYPGSHGGYFIEKYGIEGFDVDFAVNDQPYGGVFWNQDMLDKGRIYPHMEGQAVFKMAVRKFPEVITETLEAAGLGVKDIDLLVPHQANLRINQFVAHTMGLRDDQVYNNIMRYGNTTAASIPIALSEARDEGRVKKGDLVTLAAFGAGFTWAAAVLRWGK
ncbi:3-oxoacyl-[acyl-carrier-protein] synthase-3 [Lewinella marina]|uniref:Beta-ketoacyl-[acyl-carrier-protein] synthase III n=1 Tax=Neolewinella marina TaxID=438751 RepID=A0A2G0CF31_9BACT|nr:beta-ketoacyl-ACP synthase III [Neolewinella marina]NJB85803.1 3-oxoacyl-[acyl-carrier-protein] synthase-3 [Neolewinella marina]PHK98527.1 3-oxoacyl-ACP synthase [Neolewinella marina]